MVLLILLQTVGMGVKLTASCELPCLYFSPHPTSQLSHPHPNLASKFILIVFLTPRVWSSKVGHSVASKTFIVALFWECEIRLSKSTLSESLPWDQKHPVCLPLPNWPRIRQGCFMMSSPHSRNEGCVCPLHKVSAQLHAPALIYLSYLSVRFLRSNFRPKKYIESNGVPQ